MGPTGSGKSALALEVAERTGAEIVAADAFTVYRGMDIGTAKPSPEQRAGVAHHMMDVLDPWEDCTARWFQAQGRAVIAQVHARGRLPLLVGGSGLYLRALVDPLRFPPTDAAVRERIHEPFAHDPEAAHRRLAELDPQAAAKMDPANLRRAVRALEVIELTGEPFSSFSTAWGDYRSVYPRLRLLGLEMPRALLHERLDTRVDAMVHAGWLDEVRALRALGRPLSPTAAQAIGYAELWEHVDGALPLDEAVARTKMRTRRYAVRQQRWFARDPRVQWVAPRSARAVLEELIG